MQTDLQKDMVERAPASRSVTMTTPPARREKKKEIEIKRGRLGKVKAGIETEADRL